MNAIKTMVTSMAAAGVVFGVAAIARKLGERRAEKEVENLYAEFDEHFENLKEGFEKEMKNFREELERVPLEECEQGDLFRAFKKEEA